MRNIRRSRFTGVALLLALLLLLGLSAVVRAEEVTIEQYPDSNYQPGPGWPEGWTPPPVPAELPEHARKFFEDYLKQFPLFSGMEVRVLEPLPKWTQGYPYRWALDKVECGSILYIYWYPEPDTHLIYETYGRTFGGGKLGNGPCILRPVHFINESIKPDPETIASNERMIAVQEEMDRSRQGLRWHLGAEMEGNPDRVYVFLNHGYASERFDVPACLDASIGRVRVPIRFVSELMGAQVSWDDQTGQVTISFPLVSREVLKAVPKEGFGVADFFRPKNPFPEADHFLLEKRMVSMPAKTIILTIGQPKALVDGKEVAIDAPPVVKEGRTMVPIRFVAEQLGSKVYWVGDKPIFEDSKGRLSGTYQVHIFTPFFPLYDYPSWFLESRAVKF